MDELFRFSVIRPIERSAAAKRALPAAPVAAAPAPVSTRGGKTQPAQPAQPAANTTFVQQAVALVTSMADSEPPIVVWNRLEPIAITWLKANGTLIAEDAAAKSLDTMIADLRVLASADPAPVIDGPTIAAIVNADANLAGQPAIDYAVKLTDLLLALIVVRRAGAAHVDELIHAGHLFDLAPLIGSTPTLVELAERIAATGIIADAGASLVPKAASAAEALALFAATLEDTLGRTMTVPNALFARLRKPMFGVGFRDFHVVKQQIRRYQRSEIARIENIMAGEERDHHQRHILSTEIDTFTSTETTTETDKELTSTDHVDIKNETQAQVAIDTKVDGGVHAQYDGGSYKIQADLNVGYDKATNDTSRYASVTAKDVTQKAVSKVTQAVTRSQTTKIKEQFEEIERQRFKNGDKTHLHGLYQWMEKVYICQTFSLGRHMLLDMMVPEPSAHLLALATETQEVDPLPVQPHVLGAALFSGKDPVLDSDNAQILKTPLDPLSLDPVIINNKQKIPGNLETYYGTWVGRYNTTGVKPPPDETKIITKSLVLQYKDDTSKSAVDILRIPDGYVAHSASFRLDAIRNDNAQNNADIWISVALGSLEIDTPLEWTEDGRTQTFTQNEKNLLTQAGGELSLGIDTRNINEALLVAEVTCMRSDASLDQWRLETYEKIAAAHADLDQAYKTAIQSRKIASAKVGPLGAADPVQNRLTERSELKRACIAIMSQDNATVGGGSATASVELYSPDAATDPLFLPEPKLAGAGLTQFAKGSQEVRWFEQAFEWENIAYVLYPYFWGRRSQWTRNLMLKNDDPLFLNFLQAGYARVVVPVRHGFERGMLMYLNTGLPWLGDRMPPIGDPGHNPLYLDVADEIKALTSGGERGEVPVPIDEPWEYLLPTTFMYLRSDDSLPTWKRLPPSSGKKDLYAQEAPPGTWSWEIDDPEDGEA